MSTNPTSDASNATAADAPQTASSAAAAARKRPMWASPWFYVVIVFVLVPVGLILWLAIAGDPKHQLSVDPQTTVLTGPITSEGLVDYAEALRERHRDEVSPEENACRPIIEAVGPSLFSTPESAALAYEELDMSPLPTAGDYRVTLRDVMEQIAVETGATLSRGIFLDFEAQSHDLAQVPWSADDHPEMARWTAANEVPLEAIREASLLPGYRHPVLVSPGGGLMELMLPIAQELRDLSRLLAIRAMQRVHDGDPAAAWEDILTIHRLSRLHAQGDTAIEYLVACSMTAVATDAMQPLLSSPELTPELLAQIQRDWQSLPAWPEVADVVDNAERWAMLDVIQHTARFGPRYLTRVMSTVGFSGGTGDFRGLPANAAMTRAVNAMVDWDQVMIDANEWYDRIAVALDEPDPAVRERMVDDFDDDLEALATDTRTAWFPSTHNIGGKVISSMLPAFTHMHEEISSRDARMALINATLAIERYRLDHERLPAALSDLVPHYLPAVPLDPHSPGDELLYLRQGDDGYVLYSVGQGYDDGGLTENKDLTFRVRMPTPEWLLPPARITDPGAEQVQ